MTALKTTSLRLRGTEVSVLEEEGLDSEGAVSSKSKLQSKVKALSGVDILTDTGAYKSTYQILSEIADVWSDINNMDQAALLELISGKRNSSVIAAILQNPEELKAAFEDANNAQGSALKENEKYLDSIQGKIDQFNNASQTMWSNFLDSDVVKGIVEIGTWIVRVIDKVGILTTAFATFATVSMIKNKTGPVAFLQGISDIITGTAGKVKGFVSSIAGATAATSAYTAETLSASVANGTLSASEAASIASKNGLTLATTNLTAAEAAEMIMKSGVAKSDALAMVAKLGLTTSTKALSLADIEAAVSSGALTTAQAAQISSALGLTAANTGLSASFAALWTAMWPILAMMAGVAAIYGIVKIFDSFVTTTAELKEELDGLNSEISDLESEIDSLNSELDTTKERMAELLALPSLSFVEQEELNELKQTAETLERLVKLKEKLKGSAEATRESAAKKYIDKAWNQQGEWYVNSDGYVKKDSGWTAFWTGDSQATTKVLDQAMEKYREKKQKRDLVVDTASNWDSASDYDKYVASMIATGNYYVSEEVYNKNPKQYIISNPNFVRGQVSGLDDQLVEMEAGIAQIFSAQNDFISENELTYGMSDAIDKYLDEVYAYSLSWQQAQGNYVKPDAISSMFDSTSTKEMQAFGKALQEIADSDLTDEEKNAKILEQLDGLDGTIGDGVNKIDGATDAYNRLHLAMETVGVTAQDISDYFVLKSGAFNSSTMEGIIAQYELGLNNLNSMRDNEDLFNQVFDADGEVVETKIAEMMNGADETTREEFSKLLQAIKDGAYRTEEGLIDWQEAIESFSISGSLRGIQLAADQLSEINVDIFPGLEDEIQGIIDTFDELIAAVGNTVSAMDALEKARAEEAYSGSVSLETLEQLMKSTSNYADLIEIDETGAIKLAANAHDILVQEKIEAIKKNAELALSTARMQLAEAEHSQQIYRDSSPAQEALRSAYANVAYVIALVSSLLKDLSNGNWDGNIDRALAAANKAKGDKQAEYSSQAAQAATSVSAAKKAVADAEKMNQIAQALTPENIKGRYDSDDASGGYATPEDLAAATFQKEMDYWENRIDANQAKYEQLQNEIDLLEAKGQKADTSFYLEQIELEKERKWLLKQQKAEAQERLKAIEAAGNEGSEAWWEVADVLNDIEGELDDVTSSILDLQDAIGEIDTYKFDEFNTRLDDLTSKLETIRGLMAPNGEEDWFDDEGNWTDAGVAVLGAHIQELEFDKEGLAKAQDELNKYSFSYEGNEDYYEALGIHSEQEYYDKVEELTEQQYQYLESISDTEQSIVDMYESNIDAVEAYTETLIDSYNDYIDSVKEALDAERDLYDFKKNVQKQTKDIASLERRIASLSGSTNAADIAERRKLEAQLYESRESLNDTYYDHAKDAQNEALETEQAAYEESMNKFVEGLRTSLEEATSNMDEFLMGVTSMVMYNADTVLVKYQETNLPLTEALTNPWEEAIKATDTYSGNALDLMNKWTQDGGFFLQFSSIGTTSLESPWSVGADAANTFKDSIDTVMSGVVSNIESNVKKAKASLASLTDVITATDIKADGTVGENYSGNTDGNKTTSSKKWYSTATLNIGTKVLTASASANDEGSAKAQVEESLQDQFYTYHRQQKVDEEQIATWWKNRKKQIKYNPSQCYAKGTIGTKRNQWAITDEPQFGDELVLVPGKDGNLSFMRKGTGIVPADLTANLMEWGQFTPDSLNLGGNVNVNMINNAVIKPQYDFSFDSLVHVDNCSQETLKDLEKMVDSKIDKFSKDLNYSIKRFAR